LRKFINLVLLIDVLAVDIAAVRECHCAVAVSQRWSRLCRVRRIKAGGAHFDESFWLQHCINSKFSYCCWQLK